MTLRSDFADMYDELLLGFDDVPVSISYITLATAQTRNQETGKLEFAETVTVIDRAIVRPVTRKDYDYFVIPESEVVPTDRVVSFPYNKLTDEPLLRDRIMYDGKTLNIKDVLIDAARVGIRLLVGGDA